MPNISANMQDCIVDSVQQMLDVHANILYLLATKRFRNCSLDAITITVETPVTPRLQTNPGI